MAPRATRSNVSGIGSSARWSAIPQREPHADDRVQGGLSSKQSAVTMSVIHEGRCLCGDVCYKTLAEPLRVTICHCRFCQKFTGSAYLLEPIFRKQDVVFE